MGWGAVLRDHMGNFLLSCCEGLAEFLALELAEGLAIRRALIVSKDNGYMKLVLVSDCLSIIQRISSPVRDRSSMGAVVDGIKSLAVGFESCSFKFSSQKSNVVAHVLARFAEPLVCKVSIGVIPECIGEELCNDVT